VNVRVLPRAAIKAALKLTRLPLDSMIALLPGDGRGAKPAAKLALDRADATVRAVMGAILSDPALREDAERRHRAAQDRQAAVELREEAERTGERAEARLEQREDSAREQRERAVMRERGRRRQARTSAEDQKRRATETERNRRTNSRQIKNRREEEVAKHEPRERLDALEAQSDALRAKQAEVAVRDEAERLAEAASRTKARRKQP
jgi:hypothetical protein